jgi:uncharacterized protein (TIGR04551 family)
MSDPNGSGKPPHRDNPVLTDLSTRIEFHGFYRIRTAALMGLDLNRGPTPSGTTLFPVAPSGARTLTGGDMRLRLEMRLSIARSVNLVVRVDALDNLVLGSTPYGSPRTAQVPMIVATPGQQPPSGGTGSFSESLRVKRAYGEVLLPLGLVMAGRMGPLVAWGLGLAVNGGNELDDDVGDNGDRIAFALPILGHLLTFAYDFSASGPVVALPNQPNLNLDPNDDVTSWGVVFANYDPPETLARKLRAGMSVINYGILASYRSQDLDVPTYYNNAPQTTTVRRGELVQRNAWSMLADAWFLFRTRDLRIEAEFVFAYGEIANGSLVPGVSLTKPVTSTQYGGVLQIAYAPHKSRWGLGLEIGMASGDDAPGFGITAPANKTRTVRGDMDGPQINYPNDTTSNNLKFHANYRVDLIFWRRIVGQVTDALYVKGGGHVDLTDRFRLWASAIYSRAMEATTPPGQDANLGVEFNVGIRYDYDPGFEFRLTGGVFLPFAGLRNSALNLEPEAAFAVQMLLGYVF